MTGTASSTPSSGDQAQGSGAGRAASTTGRTQAGMVLSATTGMLYVIGGKNTDGHWAKTLRSYDPTSQRWFESKLQGKLPRQVLAATYQPSSRSLIVVDQKRWFGMRWARLLQVDLATGTSRMLGMWPKHRHMDKVFLSLAEDGTLLLAGSSRRRTFIANFDLTNHGRRIRPGWVVIKRGRLALSPTLTSHGLTIPMKRDGQVNNQFVPTADLRGGSHRGLGSCL
jgi:hypothetical protein